ncbi:hypothetical protein [Hwangdonia lutea]|uniref:Intradiol ring-cleavage dioxygenases domain-containing protein n=1 Tax=Hwangdonia lutea TaxID=3075823 RepID=A0AA97EJ57_9FLAO|nr:hypothetical protein [Hwangdonia sp. SCSIO 19198]WOD42192.1 hypothetical protein RNZ46_09305 [Hwangdonia sp. SCSIO 19198]
MKKLITIILLTMLHTHCAIDRNILPLNDIELETLEVFKDFEPKHQIQISDKNEAGQKLWLCLTFESKENNVPLINQKIQMYHTTSKGEYEPTNPNDESTARLNGEVFTNEKGQVFVKTILPGDYGSSADNRHIHTTVINARPEAYDIHFKQFTGQMSKNFISGSDQHFLADLKRTDDSTLVSFLTIAVKQPQNQNITSSQKIPDCQWCGASEAPENISWETRIADENTEGERLILEGTIFEADGKTPAENVIVYAYHTNAKGRYEKKGNETGNGVRHGYLRAWAKTNHLGKYRFYTIKPAPYPNNAEPAHVHMTLMREDFKEYWINATWFKGDKIITKEMTEKLDRTGGFSNIIELVKNEENIWIGKRDIILNPPNE